MLGWEDSTLPGCGVPVPASGVQTSPHSEAIFFCLCVSLPGPDTRPISVTAGIWDTHLIVCCLILAVQVWTDPLFCPCPRASVSTLFFFFKLSLGKSFRDIATFTANCAGKTLVKVVPNQNHVAVLLLNLTGLLNTSIRVIFVKTSLMSSDLLSLMTQHKESYCSASCCVEWVERQSEWFLSSSWTD